ncbi:MAG: DUF4269 domain-containing protein [Saprospiraceae bacterium]
MTFTTIAYLQSGTPSQRRAWRILTRYRVLEKLEPYDPILTGTIPIGIDIDSSDLDICCNAPDLPAFRAAVETGFRDAPGFSIREKSIHGQACVVANFELDGFPVELFGQAVPTRQQNAYRHMLVEHRILQERGAAFRQQIIALKKQGIKTEPAFARLLGLNGDPYLELLSLESEPLNRKLP